MFVVTTAIIDYYECVIIESTDFSAHAKRQAKFATLIPSITVIIAAVVAAVIITAAITMRPSITALVGPSWLV